MHEEFAAAAKASPAVGGVVYSSLTLNDWAAIATIIYVALQIILLLPKYRTAFPKLWAKAKVFLANLSAATIWASVKTYIKGRIAAIRGILGK